MLLSYEKFYSLYVSLRKERGIKQGDRCGVSKNNCEVGVLATEGEEDQAAWTREGRQPPPHSFRTSFYLFAAVRVPRGLPNLPQTVFREGSSIYNRQFLLKTGLIWLFKHGSRSIVSLTFEKYFLFCFLQSKFGLEKLKLCRFCLKLCLCFVMICGIALNPHTASKPPGSEAILGTFFLPHSTLGTLGTWWFLIPYLKFCTASNSLNL